MVGRAGRKGIDSTGESILICKSSERNFANILVKSELRPVKSCLVMTDNNDLHSSLKRAILEVIASGTAKSEEEISQYVSCTLLSASMAAENPEGEETNSVQKGNVENAMVLCLQYLVDNEFILPAQSETGADIKLYHPTRLGQAVLASGFSPDDSLCIMKELQLARQCFVLENDLHILYEVTPPYLSDQLGEINWLNYLSIWEQLDSSMRKVGELVGVEEQFMGYRIQGQACRVKSSREARRLAVHRRFYATLALNELIQEVPLAKVAKKYDCTRGILQSLQQTTSTFAGMLTVFCTRLGWYNLQLLFSQFQKRVHFGIQQELCDLVRLSSVNGQRARILYNGGYETVAATAAADVQDLTYLLATAAPFQSAKPDEVAADGPESKHIWISGQRGMNNRDAAIIIIEEARRMIEQELGIKNVQWKTSNTEAVKISSQIKGNDTSTQSEELQTTTNNQSFKNRTVSKTLVNFDYNACDSSNLNQVVGGDFSTRENAADSGVGLTICPGNNENRRITHITTEKANDSHNLNETVSSNLKRKNPSDQQRPTNRDLYLNTSPDASERNCLGSHRTEPSADRSYHTKLKRKSPLQQSSDLTVLDPKKSKLVNDSYTDMVDGGFSFFSLNSFDDSSSILTKKGGQQQADVLSDVRSGSEGADNASSMMEEAILSQAAEMESIYFSKSFCDQLNNEVNMLNDFNEESEILNKTENGDQVVKPVSVNCSTPLEWASTKKLCHPISPLAPKERCNAGDFAIPESEVNQWFDKFTLEVCTELNNQESSSDVLANDSSLQELFQTATQSDNDVEFHSDVQKLNDSGKSNDENCDLDMDFGSPFSMLLAARTHVKDRIQESSNLNCENQEITEGNYANESDRLDSGSLTLDLVAEDLILNQEHLNNSCKPMTLLTTKKLDEVKQIQQVSSLTLDLVTEDFDGCKSIRNCSKHPQDRKENVALDFSKMVQDCSLEFTDTVKETHKATYSPSSSELFLDSSIPLGCDFLAATATKDEQMTNNYHQRSGDGGVPRLSDSVGVSMPSRSTEISQFATTRVGPNETNFIEALQMAKITKVTNNAFNKFIAQWKRVESFAFAFAIEKVSITKVIGPQKYKGKKDHQTSKCLHAFGTDLSVVGMSVCWGDQEAFYVPLQCQCFFDESLKEICLNKTKCIRDVFENHLDKKTVIAYDLRLHYSILYQALQVTLQLKKSTRFQDPSVAAWLLNPEKGQMSLQMLAKDYLTEEYHILGCDMESGSLGMQVGSSLPSKDRACIESVLCFELMQELMEQLQLQKFHKSFNDIEMPSVLVIAKMEQSGFGLDSSLTTNYCTELQQKQQQLLEKAHRLAGRKFNLTSSKDVARVLYKELRLCPVEQQNCSPALNRRLAIGAVDSRKNHQLPSELKTNKESLEKIKHLHPLPGLILDWRKITFSLSKVLMPLVREKKLHNVTGLHRVHGSSYFYTVTGRVNMHSPNLQFIPRDFDIDNGDVNIENDEHFLETSQCQSELLGISIRNVFIASSGYILLSADYSQLELRLLAHLSSDRKLAKQLNSGNDVFKMIASCWKSIDVEEVTDKMRQEAKQICYGIIYGVGAKRLGHQLAVDEEKASAFIDSFKDTYPGVKFYLKKVVEKCREKGYVQTLANRRRYLPKIERCSAAARARAERQAVNTTIQGSAADLVKSAIIKIDYDLGKAFRTTRYPFTCNRQASREKLGGFLVLQLHDELIFEVSEKDLTSVANIVKKNMENCVKLSVKLPVKLLIGNSWGSMHELKI